MKKITAFLLAAVLLFGLSSCGKNDELNIYFPIESDVHSLDPQIVTGDAGVMIALNIFDCLVRIDDDGSVVPAAAERWTVSANGLVWVFDISEDSRWYFTDTAKNALGDKIPADLSAEVTADDFVFAFRRAVSPEINAPERELLSPVAGARDILDGNKNPASLGVKALSPRRLQITLAYNDPDFVKVLARPLCAPCNRTFYEATNGRYGVEMKYLCSNGPFFVTRKNAGAYIRISRSDEYGGPAPAKAAAVWFYVNADASLIPGKIADGIYEAGYVNDRDKENFSERRFSASACGNGVNCFVFNTADRYLSEKKLREAICSAMNPETITAQFGQEADLFIPSDVRDMLPPFSFVAKKTYDRDEAHKLLLECYKKLGITNISLRCLCTAEDENALRYMMQDWQEALGTTCGITPEIVTASELRSAVRKGEFDMAFMPLSFGIADAESVFSYVSSVTGTDDEALAETVAKMKAADRAELSALCGKACDYFMDGCCVYPVSPSDRILVQSKSVRGIYNCGSAGMTYFHKAEK